MLEVYTWQPNANAGKPLFCLHEKGVPFTCRAGDMGRRAHFSPAPLAIGRDRTPSAAAPDGSVVTESMASVEYPAERFGLAQGAAA